MYERTIIWIFVMQAVSRRVQDKYNKLVPRAPLLPSSPPPAGFSLPLLISPPRPGSRYKEDNLIQT